MGSCVPRSHCIHQICLKWGSVHNIQTPYRFKAGHLNKISQLTTHPILFLPLISALFSVLIDHFPSIFSHMQSQEVATGGTDASTEGLTLALKDRIICGGNLRRGLAEIKYEWIQDPTNDMCKLRKLKHEQ